MPSPQQLLEQARASVAAKRAQASSAPINVPPLDPRTPKISDIEGDPTVPGKRNLQPGENILMSGGDASDLLDPPGTETDLFGTPIADLQHAPKFEAPPLSVPQTSDGDYPEPPRETDTAEDAKMWEARNVMAQRSMSASDKNIEIFAPPRLQVEDGDIIRFLECMRMNKFYSETFIKGPLKVTFRVKSATELDFQRACLSGMMDSFNLMSDYQDAISRYNMLFQLQSFNGIAYPRVVIPAKPWTPEKLNLEVQFWASPIAQMTEACMFVVNGMMAQFENKVYEIEKTILQPGFTLPGVPT